MLGEHNYKCLISDSSQNISLEISNDTKTLWTEKGQINSITRENLEHFSSFKLMPVGVFLLLEQAMIWKDNLLDP